MQVCLVVDDDLLLRQTLVSVSQKWLGSNWLVCEAGTLDAAVSMIKDGIDTAEGRAVPDLVMLDRLLPDAGGLDGLITVRAALDAADRADTPVMMISGNLRPMDEAAVHDAGGCAILRKQDLNIDELGDTIKRIVGLPVSSSDNNSGDVAARRTYTFLTSRQNEILHWRRQGLTERQTAERLHLSPETVKSHMKTIRLKLPYWDQSVRNQRESV